MRQLLRVRVTRMFLGLMSACTRREWLSPAQFRVEDAGYQRRSGRVTGGAAVTPWPAARSAPVTPAARTAGVGAERPARAGRNRWAAAAEGSDP